MTLLSLNSIPFLKYNYYFQFGLYPSRLLSVQSYINTYHDVEICSFISYEGNNSPFLYILLYILQTLFFFSFEIMAWSYMLVYITLRHFLVNNILYYICPIVILIDIWVVSNLNILNWNFRNLKIRDGKTWLSSFKIYKKGIENFYLVGLWELNR